MTKRRFEKHVAIKATDDEERIATGLVLRPNVLDRQLDFFEPDGVEAMFNPNPDDGVMHAAFPEGHAELVRNEILAGPEEIDGVEFNAGDWVVRRQYHDEQRWALVSDGILRAFSMGGHITRETTFDTIDDLPGGVDIPDEVDPEQVPDRYWPPARAENGAVEEISDVDIPAVPAAQMASVKSVGKNLLEETEGEEEFVELMVDRGHDEADAHALYQYLTDATQHETMTDEDITQMDDATLGKRIKRFLLGAGEPDDAERSVEVTDAVKGDALAVAREAIKEGRPLNAENRAALMAAHDAIEAALASDIDFETNRFTDNENIDFSIDEFGKVDDTETMTDDDTDKADDGVDVKELAEQVSSLASTVEQINEKLDEGEESEKSTEEQLEELEEKFAEQESELEQARERLDKLSSSTADTAQADGVDEVEAEKTDEAPGLNSPDMAAKLFGIQAGGD